MRYLAAIALTVLLTACTAIEPLHTPVSPQPTSEASIIYCGGMTAGGSQTCAGENEYCHREIKDMCGAADAPGVCRETPQMCTMDYSPVCGCDEQTYPNECAANSKGVSAAYEGECKS